MADSTLRACAAARSINRALAASLVLLLLGTPSTVSHGQSGGVTSGDPGSEPAGVPAGVIRVEEDWKILVTDPSPATDSPQITVVFGPADPESKTHAVFEVNHSTQPSYLKGGMQLQCWWGEDLVEYRNQHHPSELYVSNETVTFTTATEVRNNKIMMEVIQGKSESFGTFGGEVYLRTTISLSKANLDGFDPEFSLKHSRCGWGKNRVGNLSRTAIRYYDVNGALAFEEKTERILHKLTP